MTRQTDDLAITDGDRLQAIFEQVRIVTYLLGVLLLLGLVWSFWFVMNRNEENAARKAEERIECMDTGRNC